MYQALQALKQDLRPGSPASARSDTLNLLGFVEKSVEIGGTDYTIMRLGELTYHKGSPGGSYTSSYSTPNGFIGSYIVTVPETKAYILIGKGKLRFALPIVLPKKRSPYLLQARLTRETIIYEMDSIVVVQTLGPGPDSTVQAAFPGDFSKHGTVILSPRPSLSKEHKPNAWDLNYETAARSYHALKPPILPPHIKDLNWRAVFLCKTNHDLLTWQIGVPPDYTPEIDWPATAELYKEIGAVTALSGCVVSQKDAMRLHRWILARQTLEHADQYVLGTHGIWYFGMDREGIVQNRKDRKATTLAWEATATDSLWGEPYNLLHDIYYSLGEPQQGAAAFALGVQRMALSSDSPDRKAFRVSGDAANRPQEGWFSSTFRNLRQPIPEPSTRGRQWSVGFSSEAVAVPGWEFSVLGINGLYFVQQDISLEAGWTPGLLADEHVGSIPKSSGSVRETESDWWKADRFSLEARYQFPVRLQLWSMGFRLHAAAGVAHYHREERFRVYELGEEITADASGWAPKVGIGLTQRSHYSTHNTKFLRLECGYRLGSEQEVETRVHGVSLPLLLGPGNTRATYDPSGFYFSCYYFF